nr:hypothetical protein [Chromobacterium vaccinii]
MAAHRYTGRLSRKASARAYSRQPINAIAWPRSRCRSTACPSAGSARQAPMAAIASAAIISSKLSPA